MPKPANTSLSASSALPRPSGKVVDDPSGKSQEMVKEFSAEAQTGKPLHLRLIHSEKASKGQNAADSRPTRRPSTTMLLCLAAADGAQQLRTATSSTDLTARHNRT